MQFEDLFQNINVPILVYEEGITPTVIYENLSAASLLNPFSVSESREIQRKNIPLKKLLKIPDVDFQLLAELLMKNHKVSEVYTKMQLPSGECISVIMSANKLSHNGRSYVKLCIYPKIEQQLVQTNAKILLSALHAAYEGETMESAIQNMLSCLGQLMHVSKISVYEAISHTDMRNTYEWDLSDVETKIDLLQMIPRHQLYNNIMDHQFVIDENSRTFFAGDETVVGASEYRSMLSVPILAKNGSLGYMVVNGHSRCHQWSREDIHLLSDFAAMLAFFMTQREEHGLRCNWSILSTVTEHLDDLILVHDLDSEKILFANRALAEATSMPLEELEGKNRRQVMRKLGRSALEDSGKRMVKRNHSYEFCNVLSGKWYLVRRAIIKWIDGRDVNFETLTDITDQKNHEAKLEQIALTDKMTGVHNREWGYRLLEQILGCKDSGQESSLVFLDLDHLKRVNDCFGHAMGDEMILKTVAIIQSCIRKSDSLCRWGGDEFMIIIRANEEKSHDIVQKIQRHMNEYNASGVSPFQLKFSYGIVEINTQTRHTLESLIREADQRMYCNKLNRV
jgi:diguanylate cyclase (GGDEF)-like protein/PAS domain S-box-containing protein